MSTGATGSVAAADGRAAPLPRYERPREERCPTAVDAPCVPYEQAEEAIAASSLSDGSRTLLRGLLRLGSTRVFPGGGLGLEYGGLLKTAARPEYVAAHVAEAAAHLRERRVDLLLVPGMSGYPIGAMYSVVAGIPAVLLKKGKLAGTSRDGDGDAAPYSAGAFVIPSYTGEGDVVMHADQEAVQDLVDAVVAPQLAAQAGDPAPVLRLRAAGADDIIDKATMSRAVGDSALALGRAAIADWAGRHRAATGDARPIASEVQVVAWVTPLIKGYNRPQEHLERAFGLYPFAGVNVTSLGLDPPAIGVEGVGVLAFADRG